MPSVRVPKCVGKVTVVPISTDSRIYIDVHNKTDAIIQIEKIYYKKRTGSTSQYFAEVHTQRVLNGSSVQITLADNTGNLALSLKVCAIDNSGNAGPCSYISTSVQNPAYITDIYIYIYRKQCVKEAA